MGLRGRGTGRGERTAAAFEALDARLPISEAARGLLRKVFPDHWSFLLGELALYSFVVLVLTGVYLTLFFRPTMGDTVYHGPYALLDGVRMTEAYASTLDITFDVRGGLLMRQMHHWAALLFLSSIGAHLLRVFLTGAFRRPREVNWTLGVTLFMLALLEGFCGYSLPDDLLSGTGLRTALTILGSVPVAGTYLDFFVFGGAFPGHAVIPRLYALHILLVPALLAAVVTVHLGLVVYLKHTQWAGPGRTNRNAVGHPMVPQFAAKSTGLFFLVSGVLAATAGVAQINPIWLYGPYRSDQVVTDAQPDWYVGFLEGALRLMPPWETNLWGHTVMWNVLLPAIVLPGILFALLLAYPFFERWITGDRGEHHLCDRPRDRPVRTAFAVSAVVAYAVLLLAGGNDVTAYALRLSVNALTWTFRVALVLAPPAAFVLTKRLCLALQLRDRHLLAEGVATRQVGQAVHGAVEAVHRPLDAARAHVLLVRDLPEPLTTAAGTPRRLPGRLRDALSAWYYRDRVEMPATPRDRAEVAARVAPPRTEAERDRS